jgi:hypothetical protein
LPEFPEFKYTPREASTLNPSGLILALVRYPEVKYIPREDSILKSEPILALAPYPAVNLIAPGPVDIDISP